jgi:hypothetical protein
MATESNNGAKAPRASIDRSVYADEAQARQHKPGPEKDPRGKMRLFRVSDPDGKQWFTWSDGAWNAVVSMARSLGFSATAADARPLDKGRLTAALAALSDEDRALLIQQFVPASGPAPDKPGRPKK